MNEHHVRKVSFTRHVKGSETYSYRERLESRSAPRERRDNGLSRFNSSGLETMDVTPTTSSRAILLSRPTRMG